MFLRRAACFSYSAAITKAKNCGNPEGLPQPFLCAHEDRIFLQNREKMMRPF